MSNATMTAAQSFSRVQESVEKIDRSKPQRFPEAASAGDSFRQGDLYITRLDALPSDIKPLEAKPGQDPAQLAEGTTQGSRHVLDSLEGVEMYELATKTALDGPILNLAKERTVTHPEHGHVCLPPGSYAITYQRAYAEELRRVAD